MTSRSETLGTGQVRRSRALWRRSTPTPAGDSTDLKTILGRTALKAARWTGAARLARHGTRPFGAIFTLHHVSPEPIDNLPPNGHLRISPAFLSAVIRHLRARGYDFVDLHQVVERIRTGPEANDRFFVAFTLDDGYRDNLVHAAPIFAAENVPYTIFVSPGLCERTVMPWWEIIEEVVCGSGRLVLPHRDGQSLPAGTWAEKRRAFDQLSLHLTTECPEDEVGRRVEAIAAANGLVASDSASRVMDWADLRSIGRDPLCTIGAHSMTHPRLSRLPPEKVEAELDQSRRAIGEKLGRRPDFFAYPYGSPAACGRREFDIAAGLGFKASFTTRLHALTRRTAVDVQALPRLSLNGYYQDPRYIDVLISGLPGLWKER